MAATSHNTTNTTPNSPQDAYLRIRLPMPHTGQRLVRAQMRRFNWLCAGRRWRKTTTGLSVAVEHAVHGGSYVWGAPTFKQVRVGWEELRRACGTVVTFNESRMEALFPDTGHGAGRIDFISLDDPDNARGKTANGIIIDEASEVAARAWQEILRPMLMDTGGWMLAMFTPKGRNWTWSEVMAAQHGDDPESVSWQIPSLGCVIDEERGELLRVPHPLENPELRFSELEYMFQTMPRRTFQQEILAEFLDDAGGVFRNVEGCVGGAVEAGPPNRVYEYVIGVDLAKHLDYTVLCVGDLRAQRVVAFDRFNKSDWPLQKARIVSTATRWNNATIWMDATGIGDVVYDDLRAANLRVHPYKFTAASKDQLIHNAVLMVEQQQVHYPRIPILLEEMKALQYTRREVGGGYRIEAPEGLHDDAVMAFCLMCWPMQHSSGSGMLTQSVVDALRGAPISGVNGVKLLGRTF